MTKKEENKKLKSDLAFERTMLDNVRAEYKSLQNVIKKLKEWATLYREDNKKLRAENVKLKDIILTDDNFEEKQENEIKKLKEDVDYRHHRAMVAERWWEDED